MSKKSVKAKKTSKIENDLNAIIERKKSENQALQKLLEFFNRDSKKENTK